MAKYDVTGLTIDEIMDIDLDTFNKLSARELKVVTSRLVSASNKRIRGFEKKGIVSPAMRSLGTRTRFSVRFPKGTKNVTNKVRQEFARARSFLTAKTSTIKGYRQYEKQVREDIESQIGRKLNDGEIGKAYRILHKMQESGQIAGRGSKGSLQAREIIFDILNDNFDLDDDSIMDMAEEDYEDFYETSESDNIYNE